MDTINHFALNLLSLIKVTPNISVIGNNMSISYTYKGRPSQKKRNDACYTLDNNIGFSFEESLCKKSDDIGLNYLKYRKFILRIKDSSNPNSNEIDRSIVLIVRNNIVRMINAEISDAQVKAVLHISQESGKIISLTEEVQTVIDSKTRKRGVSINIPNKNAPILKISEIFYDEMVKDKNKDNTTRFRTVASDSSILQITHIRKNSCITREEKVSGLACDIINDAFHNRRVHEISSIVSQTFSAAFPGIMNFISNEFPMYDELTSMKEDTVEPVKSEIENVTLQECSDMKPSKYLRWKPNNSK